MRKEFFISLFLLLSGVIHSQKNLTLINSEDLKFLFGITKATIDSSKIKPGQKIDPDFGPNNTGGMLIRPGGRAAYPAFWIRDYAMSIETGMVSLKDQLHMLLLTAGTQADYSRITKNGSLIPYGAIADHIRIDNSLPIYYPGTYSYTEQGTKEWGMMPPICDQFYFIDMAWYYVKSSKSTSILQRTINSKKIIDRLETAFALPTTKNGALVYTDTNFRAVDFGFRDAITITGDLCFPSILKYKAAKELSELFTLLKNTNRAKYYDSIALLLKQQIPEIFSDSRGMLKASTGLSQQADVWSTVFAAWLGILDNDALKKAATTLSAAYEKGTLAHKGNIRHVLDSDDFNKESAWEIAMAAKNKYQNGAYWGTPTGWVAWTIAQVNRVNAKKLIKEYIDDLRETDFRKGPDYGGPFECFYPPSHKQNPIYMTTVACPLIVFQKLATR